MVKAYRILTAHNLPELAKLTGKPKVELEAELRQAIRFDATIIVWTVLDRWYMMRIDNQYPVELVADVAMERYG